jgi:copper(I)-binding protein
MPSVLGVGLAVVLTGCGAGQITQTSSQLASVNGASGNAGPIAIRNAQLAFPTDNKQGVLAPGSSTTLIVTIVNTGLTADTLVKVDSPAVTGVLVNGSASGSAPLPGNFAISSGLDPDDGTIIEPASTAPTTASVAPSSTSASTSATSTSASTTTGASASVSATPSVAAPPPGRVTIELVGIKSINGAPLRAGMTIPITFYFAHAGQVTIGQVPISAPADNTVVATPSGGNG